MTSSSASSSFISQALAYLKSIAVLYLFWIVLFQLARIIFYAYHYDKLDGLSPGEIINASWKGLPMDLSASTYLFTLPMLCLFAGLWLPIEKFTNRFLKWYVLAGIALVATITFTDVEIYANWGYKLNAEALTYLSHPKEALASSTSSPLIPLILGIILFTTIVYRLFNKYALPLIIIPSIKGTLFNYIGRGILMVSTIGLAIIAIRGGIGLSNMGPGHAYHSQHQILNHAATNSSWNFLYSVQKINSELPCQYHFMEDEKATKLTDNILQENPQADSPNILSTASPNVVFIILEGWPVDVTASFGGLPDITPYFDSLALGGLRFTNIYSSGDRTYKGVPAVLSGFPAFPSGSIIQYIQKMEQLPCIASSMESKSYDTQFIYGGDIEFKSISSYITHCGFDQILSQDDFPAVLAEGSKWGVHDHHVFERAAIEIDKLEEPFFSTILTLSSHEPYDVPIPTKFPGDDVSEQFKNSVYYADWSLHQFFKQIKDKEWYDNTLFVFTSDHGKPLPVKREAWEHETFHIPALIYGQPLKAKYRGMAIEKIGSQLDIVKTLLNQLDIPSDNYAWSRDLINPTTTPFAFYSFESGVGTVTLDGDIVYDRVSGRVIGRDSKSLTPADEIQLMELKAFLQSLCSEFEEM